MKIFSQGKVSAILKDLPELQELMVRVDGVAPEQAAYNYPMLNRRLRPGDPVKLNTIAVQLALGTGGRHFVIPDCQVDTEIEPLGHIMKLRYTPWQFPVLAAEEDASPYHAVLQTAESLDGIPVVAAPLHSMAPGVIVGFRHTLARPAKVAYVMTDGAALPLALSDLIRDLKQKQLLDLTVTAGQAFGGDLEAVSIPAALLAARHSGGADLIVVAMGPGMVGTGTKYGFSGIEQAWVIDIAARLGGLPVAVPRLSMADRRERHRGLSHHSRTILELTNNPALLPFSRLLPEQLQTELSAALRAAGLFARHKWYFTNEPPARRFFNDRALQVKSMGRTVADDPVFFQATVAAGYLAAKAYDRQLDSLTAVE
ncbi:MAG: DUF3866 family protein [Bacillota bacterium]|jgi:hypothetical protein